MHGVKGDCKRREGIPRRRVIGDVSAYALVRRKSMLTMVGGAPVLVFIINMSQTQAQ